MIQPTHNRLRKILVARQIADNAMRLMADDREDEAAAERERLVQLVGERRADELLKLRD